jgi:hypothetical protein
MPEERRIDAGPVMAALGGLLLVVSLFLDWFEIDEAAEGLSAWDAFEVWDLVLAAAGLAAIAILIGASRADFPLQRRALLPLGVLAFVIVVSQLVDSPPAAGEDSSVDTGAWLALAGAALMLAGAILSFARVSLAVVARDEADGPEHGGPDNPGPGSVAAAPAARETLWSGQGGGVDAPIDAPAPEPGSGMSATVGSAASAGLSSAAAEPGASGPEPREVEQAARAEAAASEPAARDELYPDPVPGQPRGSADPEPFEAVRDEDTRPLPGDPPTEPLPDEQRGA